MPYTASSFRYPLGIVSGSLGTLAVASNRIYYQPFTPGYAMLLGSSTLALQFEVTANGAGTASVGIYDSNPTTVLPLNLLASGTANITASTGFFTVNLSPQIRLHPNYVYWTAIVFSSGVTVRAVTAAAIPALGRSGTGTTAISHLFQAGSSLPNPTSGTFSNGTGNVPLLGRAT